MDKKHCRGCYDDYYNHRTTPGFDGATECWLLKSAKIVWRKKVPITQAPPWTQKAERYPCCYHQSGCVFVAPKKAR